MNSLPMISDTPTSRRRQTFCIVNNLVPNKFKRRVDTQALLDGNKRNCCRVIMIGLQRQ